MTPPELIIRDATPGDVTASARIMAEESQESEDMWRKRFLEVLGDPSRHFLVAEVDGEVVGYAQSRLIVRLESELEGRSPSGWFLSGVAVRSSHRRRGIGRALTEARLARLSDETFVYYAAEPENVGTIELHRQLGFERVGELSVGGRHHPLTLFRLTH